MLARDEAVAPDEGGVETFSVPLGPAIGQCCGGRVDLSVRVVNRAVAGQLATAAAAEDARRPHVYVFGGGHVGHALAAALALLPVQAIVVETRAEALEGMPPGTVTRLTPVPEEVVAAAPAGSAFVVLTHEHSLDFLIVAAALGREDASYVGMIGSETKKATFRSWYLKTAGGSEEAFGRLVSPIGGSEVRDKRPPVIAALAAAEILRALGSGDSGGLFRQVGISKPLRWFAAAVAHSRQLPPVRADDRQVQVNDWPPSTTIVCPVTQLAISLARNSATFATSSGVPNRPQGMLPSVRWYSSGSEVLRFSHPPPGNSIEPGAMAFTRIRFGARASP